MGPEYKNRIIEYVVNRFAALYGDPARRNVKVTDWRIHPRFSIVVQNDSPKYAANVWVPYREGGQPLPALAKIYSGNKTRHSNTHTAPGLEEGEPVILWKIHIEEDFEEVLRYIRAVCPAA